MKKIILILVVFINLLSADDYSDLFIKQLTNKNNIQCMLIDGDTIWVGTDGGVLKKDLKSKEILKFFSTIDGLPDNSINSILKVDDKVYVGTDNGLAIIKDDIVKTTLTINDNLPNNKILSLLQANGKVYVGTDNGLAILKDERIDSVLTIDDGLPNNTIFSLLEANNKIYIGTWNGLVILENDKPKRIIKNGLPSNRVNSLLAIGEKIYIGTSDGLAIFQNDKIEKVLNIDDGFEDNYINSIFKVDDKIYVGTNSGLVILKDDEVERVLGINDKLEGDKIRSILSVDDEIYIGTDYGLAVLKDDNVEEVLIEDGISDNHITSLLKVDDKIYIGTYYGGLIILEDDKVKKILTTNDGLPNSPILSLLKVDNKVYVGTYYGLAILKNDMVEKILTINDGLPNNLVFSLLKVDDKVYVGTGNILSILKDEKVEKTLTIFSNNGQIFISSMISFLRVGDKIYIGTRYGGLIILKNEKVEKVLTTNDGLPDNLIHSLLQVDDKIYVGTYNGLAILQNDMVEKTLTTDDRLQFNDAGSLLRVGDKVYVGTDNNLAILKDEKIEKVLTTNDGLPNNTIPSLLKVDDKIYIGTLHGLAILKSNPSSLYTKDKTTPYIKNNYLDLVYDSENKLLWQNESYDNIVYDTFYTYSTPNDKLQTWQGAIDYCNNLKYAKFDDWVLPNIDTLVTILRDTPIDIGNEIEDIYIDDAFADNFPKKGAYYWSSNEDSENISQALNLYFVNGKIESSNKTQSNYVRCVKTGVDYDPLSFPYLLDFTLTAYENRIIYSDYFNIIDELQRGEFESSIRWQSRVNKFSKKIKVDTKLLNYNVDSEILTYQIDLSSYGFGVIQKEKKYDLHEAQKIYQQNKTVLSTTTIDAKVLDGNIQLTFRDIEDITNESFCEKFDLNSIEEHKLKIVLSDECKISESYEVGTKLNFKLLFNNGLKLQNYPEDAQYPEDVKCEVTNALLDEYSLTLNEDKKQVYVSCRYKELEDSISFYVGEVESDPKNAIIVVGSGSDNDSLKSAFVNMGNNLYKTLYHQGYKKENIYYFNSFGEQRVIDFNLDGTKDNIVDYPNYSYSDITRVLNSIGTSKHPLLIYLIDHGSSGGVVLIKDDEKIYANNLSRDLDNFQKDRQRDVIVGIDACYSGEFVDMLKSNNFKRAIFSSVSKDELAPVSTIGEGFTYYFTNELKKNTSLENAFENAKLSYKENKNINPKSYLSSLNTYEITPFDFANNTIFKLSSESVNDNVVELNLKVDMLYPENTKVTALITPPQEVIFDYDESFNTPEIFVEKIELSFNSDKFVGEYIAKEDGIYKVTYKIEDSAGEIYESDAKLFQIGDSQNRVYFIDKNSTFLDGFTLYDGWNLLGIDSRDISIEELKDYSDVWTFSNRDKKWLNKDEIKVIKATSGFWIKR